MMGDAIEQELEISQPHKRQCQFPNKDKGEQKEIRNLWIEFLQKHYELCMTWMKPQDAPTIQELGKIFTTHTHLSPPMQPDLGNGI